MKSGHTIELSHGNEVEFVRKLGAGNTTTIHEVKSGENVYALRVPKGHGNFNTFSKFSNYIDAFYLGHAALETQGVSIPKINRYAKENYLLVEKLNLEDSFDLEAFILNEGHINASDFKNALDRLADFFETMAPFKKVKDFHLNQLVYSRSDQRWILIDWTHPHELFKKINDDLPFSVEMVKYHLEKHGKIYQESSEFKELFSLIESKMTNRREYILKEEKIFLRNLERLSDEDFLRAIENPPQGYSNNLTLKIIDRLIKMDIPDELPDYLLASHGDYNYLIKNYLEHSNSIEDLVALLSFKDSLGMKIDWNLEMKIQSIITSSDINTPLETYKKLVAHDFVTNYAKAWINRERLNIAPVVNCTEAVKSFL